MDSSLFKTRAYFPQSTYLNPSALPIRRNRQPECRTENKKLKFFFKLVMFNFKVAEHSFEVPMPNSPLLLNYLCFGVHFLQESRLTTEVFILAFLVKVSAVAMAKGLVKTRLNKWFLFIFKKIQSGVRFFNRFPTTN